MEISELTLWIARLLVLVLMYGLLLALIVALLADARAAGTPHPVVSPPPVRHVATSPPVLTLEVVAGSLPTTGREYHLLAPIEIGRVASCDICIQNRFVSTRHARIYLRDDDWVVEDLGSTNGSLLNGTPLTAPHRLTAGDRLLIGDTELAVK